MFTLRTQLSSEGQVKGNICLTVMVVVSPFLIRFKAVSASRSSTATTMPVSKGALTSENKVLLPLVDVTSHKT